MKTRTVGLTAMLAIAAGLQQPAYATDMKHATGKIAVTKYEPAPYDSSNGTKLVEIAIQESFSGDIEGTGTVRFLQALRADGSASFCGLERFVGTVGGKRGSFVLQDTGTLKGDQVEGSWFIVSGSGTDELAGISGTGGFKAKLGENAQITLDYEFAK